MAIATSGNTKFDYDPSFTGKLKIINEEGSSLAVPVEDVARFIYHCYVIPERERKAASKDWRVGLAE